MKAVIYEQTIHVSLYHCILVIFPWGHFKYFHKSMKVNVYFFHVNDSSNFTLHLHNVDMQGMLSFKNLSFVFCNRNIFRRLP